MSGIVGVYNYSRNRSSRITKEILKNMTSTLGHRGSEGEGYYINNAESVVLGYRQLNIGTQPVSNEDDTIWIIFDGEIYNSKELRDGLVKKGHIFKTESDAESIAHLYEVHGHDCLKYLRGMFAFGIWDENKEELFIARDRFGQKQIVYTQQNGQFYFASKIGTLLANTDIRRDINEKAL
jgi:asparagine synthase (glutamine-hydrolysing)